MLGFGSHSRQLTSAVDLTGVADVAVDGGAAAVPPGLGRLGGLPSAEALGYDRDVPPGLGGVKAWENISRPGGTWSYGRFTQR